MLTCVIRYRIDLKKKKWFAHYARNWGEAIPRCGADLIADQTPADSVQHHTIEGPAK
jgi:hypothetical protein